MPSISEKVAETAQRARPSYSQGGTAYGTKARFARDPAPANPTSKGISLASGAVLAVLQAECQITSNGPTQAKAGPFVEYQTVLMQDV